MRYTDQTVITKNNRAGIYDYLDGFAHLAKPLYNAALFRIRQVFTGWNKDPKERNDLQKEVFVELEKTSEHYPGIKFRKVLSYTALEKIMRATDNPDFFAGLPMQTAQDILRDAVTDFRNWLDALKEWKRGPEKFLGRPRMPGYVKVNKKTFTFTNQDAVLYPVYKKDGSFCGMELKLPKLNSVRIPYPHLHECDHVREVKVKPFHGRYIIHVSIEICTEPFSPDFPNRAGIDFGTDNIAAFVCTDGSSFVYKGGAIAANNRLFAKEKAKAVSIITKGHSRKGAHSRHLENLYYRHEMFNHDQLHKISTDIIRQCVAHKVGVIVMGVNKNWKQKSDMGKRNNQNFVSMPITKLRDLITYKASVAGIFVIEQEESYTSKADCSSADPIPVYGEKNGRPSFSGRRISRGRYRCGNGLIVNADCNGAANILRKAIPDAWSKVRDFSFLAYPDSRGFHALNPRYRLFVA